MFGGLPAKILLVQLLFDIKHGDEEMEDVFTRNSRKNVYKCCTILDYCGWLLF